jgi:hypothetical protein
MENFHIPVTEAMAALQKETDKKFTVLMQHGTMSVEYFSPDKVDNQQPHKQDELYVIDSGSGTFFRTENAFNSIKATYFLFLPVWSTVSKTSPKILLHGLSFMVKKAESKVVKIQK